MVSVQMKSSSAGSSDQLNDAFAEAEERRCGRCSADERGVY